MHPIVYDVAVSIDGFISGVGGDISAFAHDGPVVTDYQARLNSYTTCIMGRGTYEFGFKYGLKSGENPYPQMKTYVFSQTLCCPENSDIAVVRHASQNCLNDIKRLSAGPIYLCGGGAFAGALLTAGQIDQFRLKRAPVLLGGGVRLFGDETSTPALRHVRSKCYENGYVLQEYDKAR